MNQFKDLLRPTTKEDAKHLLVLGMLGVCAAIFIKAATLASLLVFEGQTWLCLFVGLLPIAALSPYWRIRYLLYVLCLSGVAGVLNTLTLTQELTPKHVLIACLTNAAIGLAAYWKSDRLKNR